MRTARVYWVQIWYCPNCGHENEIEEEKEYMGHPIVECFKCETEFWRVEG